MRLQITTVCAALTLTAAVGTAVPSIAGAQALTPQSVTAPVSPTGTFQNRESFKNLFSGVIDDFRNLPSKTNLVILGIGGAAAAAGHPADNNVTRLLSGSTSMDTALSQGQFIGSAFVQMAGAMATYAVGRATSHPTITMLGSDLFRAQVVAQTLTQSIKFSAGRTRPDGTSLSFPSGHTASAFATASVIQRNLGWKAGVPAYGVAAYVAASRVQDKRHYLSDVAFGAALGIISGRAVTVGHGDARFAVTPAATLGGGGVNFTWVGHK